MTWLNRTHIGDCRELLVAMAADGARAQTCVTSPPYYGLRDYGHAGQIGLERSPAEYVEQLVRVFRAVRDVLADDGTLWLNLGDSYAGSGRGGYSNPESSTLQGSHEGQAQTPRGSQLPAGLHETQRTNGAIGRAWLPPPAGLKQKDLIGIPWRAAFALQADGWYLRQDIIWHKPNPMPESVRDRCTKAHEYLFLLAKSERYYWDGEAMQEPATFDGPNGRQQSPYAQGFGRRTPEQEQERRSRRSGNRERKPGTARGCPDDTGSNVCGSVPWEGTTRNRRSVWTVATTPFTGAHFATFPPKLIESCILAAAPPGGVVLDPFMGSGTTGQVATDLGRQFIGCELNPEYVAMHDMRRTTIGLPIA